MKRSVDRSWYSGAMVRRLLLSFAVVAVACGGQSMTAYAPLERTTEVAPEKLLPAAEGTLLDRGYLIERKDQTEIQTKPRTLLGSEIAKDKYRYVWTVNASQGRLRIELDCKTGDEAAPTSCSDKEAPEKLVKEQQEIVEQILREAGGG